VIEGKTSRPVPEKKTFSAYFFPAITKHHGGGKTKFEHLAKTKDLAHDSGLKALRAHKAHTSPRAKAQRSGWSPEPRIPRPLYTDVPYLPDGVNARAQWRVWGVPATY
jgi:hypothetical protein